jgi:hypothetical protein
MKSHLRPCPFCARHVRTSERACPFCAAALPESFRGMAPPALPTQRLGRAALFAFGATLMGAPACDDDGSGNTADASADSGGAKGGAGGALATGGSSGSGGAMASGGTGGGTATGGTGGGSDAGTAADKAPSTVDSGGVMALYGAPAPRDAAVDDAGTRPDLGVVALYGAPASRS